MKVVLDDASLQFFCQKFRHIEDPLARCLILKAVNDMLTDKLVTIATFIPFVQSIFENEQDVYMI